MQSMLTCACDSIADWEQTAEGICAAMLAKLLGTAEIFFNRDCWLPLPFIFSAQKQPGARPLCANS